MIVIESVAKATDDKDEQLGLDVAFMETMGNQVSELEEYEFLTKWLKLDQ